MTSTLQSGGKQQTQQNIIKSNSKKASAYVNNILSKYGVSPKNTTQKPENINIQNKIISKIAAKSTPQLQVQTPQLQVQTPNNNIKNISIKSSDLLIDENNITSQNTKLKARNINEMPQELLNNIPKPTQNSNMKKITIEPEMLLQESQQQPRQISQQPRQIPQQPRQISQQPIQISQQPIQISQQSKQIPQQPGQIQYGGLVRQEKTHKINKKFDLMSESINMLLKTPMTPSPNIKSDLFSHNMTPSNINHNQQQNLQQNNRLNIFDNSNAVSELESKRQYLLNEQKREIEKIKFQREQLKSIQNRHKEIKLMKAIDDEKQKLLALQEQSKKISLTPYSASSNNTKRISSRPTFKVNKEGVQQQQLQSPQQQSHLSINNNISNNFNKKLNQSPKIFDYTIINNINSSAPSTPTTPKNNVKIINIDTPKSTIPKTQPTTPSTPSTPSEQQINNNIMIETVNINKAKSSPILIDESPKQQPKKNNSQPSINNIDDDDDIVLTKKDIEIINRKKAFKSTTKSPQDQQQIPQNPPNSTTPAETCDNIIVKPAEKKGKKGGEAATTANEPYKYYLKTEKKIVWPKENEIYNADKYANKVLVRPIPIMFISEKNKIKSCKISFANKKILLQNDYGFKFNQIQSTNNINNTNNTNNTNNIDIISLILPDNIIEMLYDILIFDNIKFIHKRR